MKKAYAISFAVIIPFMLISCKSKKGDDNLTSILSASPLVLSTNPANGAAGVPATSPVVVTFNKSIDQSTVSSTTFSFSPPVAGTYSVVGFMVTFTPTSGFAAATYTVTIPSGGIFDTDGYPVVIQHQFSFTTP